MPMHKIKSYGAWGPEVTITNVQFHNFDASTRCGSKQVIFARAKSASDYIPLHKFDQCRFTDVEDSAVFFMESPDQKWANPTDCGDFPCTAPKNTVLQFF